MPLSVEKLKGLERSFDDFGDVYISDGSGECLVYLEDVLDAVRELIAIKEAEPVMWMGPYHQTITAQHKNDADDLYQDFSVPLIRKPE